MVHSRLILASGSPQRRKLLAAAGYRFETIKPAEAAESGCCSTGGPAVLVADLALRKAVDVVRQLAESQGEVATDASAGSVILVACDTVAECDGEILGKPADVDHARKMLHRLRGRKHRVYTGVCVWHHSPENALGRPDVQVDITELEMEELTDDQIEEYLMSDLWEGKAGAFGFQDRTGWLRILQGSESNVIGLPMDRLAKMLAPLGCFPKSSSNDGCAD